MVAGLDYQMSLDGWTDEGTDCWADRGHHPWTYLFDIKLAFDSYSNGSATTSRLQADKAAAEQAMECINSEQSQGATDGRSRTTKDALL